LDGITTKHTPGFWKSAANKYYKANGPYITTNLQGGVHMKRLIALTLVMVLVLGVAVTGHAAPNGKKGGGLPPGIQKKVTLSMFANLLDLDLVPWAKDAMEKMCVKGYIKGYDDKTFKPN